MKSANALLYYEPVAHIELTDTQVGADNPFTVTTDANGSVYTAQGDAEPKVYRYDSVHSLSLSYTVERCEQIPEWGKLYILDIAVDAGGSMYVATSGSKSNPTISPSSCIQKYDDKGVHVASYGVESFVEGAYFGDITVTPSGVLYAHDYQTSQIYTFNADGSVAGMFGSRGSGDGQFGQQTLSSGTAGMDYFNNQLYVIDEPNRRVQTFDINGAYQAQFALSTATSVHASGIAVDSTGVYVGEMGTVRRYSHAGSVEMSYKSPQLGNDDVNDIGLADGLLYLVRKGTENHTIYVNSSLDVAEPLAPIIEVGEVTEAGIALNVMVNPDESTSVSKTMHYSYAPVGNKYAAKMGAGSMDAILDGPNELSFTGLSSGTQYDITVYFKNVAGEGAESTISVHTAGSPYTDALIHFVEEVTYQEYRALRIVGENFIEPGQEVYTLLMSSMTLDGEDVSACAMHPDFTPEEIMSFYPTAPISDSPLCYLVFDEIGGYAFTPTEALLLLPESPGLTSGVLSVRGSAPFTYVDSDNSDPETPPTPTVSVPGASKPLDQKPTLPKRPTFTGKSTPFAEITVTVHSDPVTCTTTADADGNWSCTLPANLPAGNHTVYVAITNPDSSTENLGPYAVTVQGGEGATVTNNTPLAPNTGFLAKHAQLVKEMNTEQQSNPPLLVFMAIGAVAALGAGGAVAVIMSRKKQLS